MIPLLFIFGLAALVILGAKMICDSIPTGSKLAYLSFVVDAGICVMLIQWISALMMLWKIDLMFLRPLFDLFYIGSLLTSIIFVIVAAFKRYWKYFFVGLPIILGMLLFYIESFAFYQEILIHVHPDFMIK